MPIHHLQPTFAGGEFAPSLHSRVDLQKYTTGLKRMKNFYAHPHGGASNRAGMKFVRATKYANRKARLVEFEFSVTQAYTLEFGHEYIRIHLDGGTLMSGGSPYEVVTTYTEAELADLKFTQSADVLYIVHPDHRPAQLMRYEDSPPDWRLEPFVFQNGPFLVSNLDTAKKVWTDYETGTSVTMSSDFDLFVPEHVGALFKIMHAVEGQAKNETFTAPEQQTLPIKCGGTWRIITHGSWGGTIQIQKSPTGAPGTWTMLRQFSSSWGLQPNGATGGDFNVNTYGTDEGVFYLKVVATALTNGSCTVDISSDPFDSTGIVEVTAVTGPRAATVKVLKQIGKTTATWDWAEGAWSDVCGYPSSILFFQDRLVLAGTYVEPQTEWMSKTGAYDDFGRSTPLEDTDGITVPLPSRKLNGIKNLVPLGEILTLTSATEWSVGPSEGGVVTPTSIDTKVHGYHGSSAVDPVLVGNRCVYVQPMGSVVRDLGYNYESNGYAGDELSIFANHLTAGHKIVDMAYQQEPDSIIWLVRDDGLLLSCTYQKEHEVIAWAWHPTLGKVESVCCIPADGFNELWLIVNRSGTRFVERMANRSNLSDPRKGYFVDCGISYDVPLSVVSVTKTDTDITLEVTAHGLNDGDLIDLDEFEGLLDADGESAVNLKRFKVSDKTADTFKLKDYEADTYIAGEGLTAHIEGGVVRKAVTSVSGYGHLEGRSVAVLADGKVIPGKVVTAGAVTLPVPASIVHVGLPYESDLQTLNVELKLDDGTMQDRKVKISQVTVRFLNSRGGWVGPEEDSLVEIVQRSNEPLGAPVALYTGDYVETINSGYERGGSVFFRQVDPLPVTILAVMPKVTPGG